MNDHKIKIEEVLSRVQDTLDTARLGYDDLTGKDLSRKISGLRNLIVFSRSVTFVLQNLSSIIPEGKFDKWYKPHQDAMKNDPVMRYFVLARNNLEKQGRLDISNSAHIKSFSTKDISRFPEPKGATGFFIGDQIGGSGWVVELADGTEEKYYIHLPNSIAETKLHFSNFPEGTDPELKGATIEHLSGLLIEKLALLVNEAKIHFLDAPASPLQKPLKQTHLRLVK